MMELHEREQRKDFVETLTEKERGVYADMIMRSLRGSWRSPRDRTYILEIIAKTGNLEYYDAESLRGSVASYFERIGRGTPDGRFWRTKYENSEVEITQLSESKVRELSSHIPDDMTWDDYRINKEFDNE